MEFIIFVRDHHSYLKATIYILLNVLSIAGMLFLLASTRLVAIITISLVVLFTAFAAYFNITTKSKLEVSDLEIFLNSKAHAEGFLTNTFWEWFPLSILFVFIFYGISWWLKTISKQHRKNGWIGFFLILLSTFGIHQVVYTSNGIRNCFPSYIKVPVLINYALQHALYEGSRFTLEQNPQEPPFPEINHIIYIVDESVRADFLQINDHENAFTPVLMDLDSSGKLLNFGQGLSATVCSDYTNILLISGLNPENLPDTEHLSRKSPTLFQYAKNAGFSTAFFDAQTPTLKPDGYMTMDDNQYIDFQDYRWAHSRVLPAYSRDKATIDILSEFINTNTNAKSRSFSFFLKNGIHFPYEYSYPDSAKYFEPIGKLENWNIEEKEEVLNNYKNSILWSVDGFFKKLDEQFGSREDILIVYTSDHGQNILDHPQIKQSHCLKTPAPEEMARVPFIFYSGNKELLKKLHEKVDQRTFNHLSHFNLFSSVIYLMGYTDESQMESSMFANNFENYTVFFSGDIYGRNELYRNEKNSFRSE